jgi:Zn-dependent protease with chaperone function
MQFLEDGKMITNNYRSVKALFAWVMAVAIFAMPLSTFGQTQIVAPKNKYKVEDDVQLGRQAAQQVQQQMPLIRDSLIDNYIESVGQRLVAAIPQEFQHPQFHYTFDVVNARDINAFALPGGPMFVNRGMIQAAGREGEMAGVMAHEISHVALRHATAQATETQKFQIGSVLGQIAGAVIGGVPGAIIGTGSQIGFGAGALKYSRKYETQADILGAQIMARAGYDPRDLARMFQIIQQQGGSSGAPEWLSSHPNPGNRYERINQEAALLRVNPEYANRDSRQFQQVQAQLRGMPRAPTMQEIARSGQRYPNGEPAGNYPNNPPRGRVPYPSTRYRTYSESNLFRVNVPDNWQQLGSQGTSIWFAPNGAYGQVQGQEVFTHGVSFGVSQTQARNLQQATQELINSLAQGNGNLRQQTSLTRINVAGRNGLSTRLSNTNEATGEPELITIVSTQLRNGQLFYMIAVAPQNEYSSYQGTFSNILRSLQLNN